MNYGYPPGLPHHQPKKPTSVLAWVAAVFGGLMILVAVVTFIGLKSCMGRNEDEGGARLSNEIPPIVITRLEKASIVEPHEVVLAYYDATISIDGSEVAVLTKTRLVYAKNGHTTAIALHDVKRVHHTEATLIGDVIAVTTTNGKSMKIEIAPLNNGPVFLSALLDAVADNGGSAE